MIVKKSVIADGDLATSAVIELVYDDGSKYSVSSIQSKKNNRISYILYRNNENNNLFDVYNKMLELLAKNYKIEINPVYYEDSESFISTLKLDNMEFKFIYDRENNRIGLINNDNNIDLSFSDKLAVYIAYNLNEIFNKKKILGSGK